MPFGFRPDPVMLPTTRDGFRLARTMPQGLYISITIGLVLCIPGFFIPIPGTFTHRPGAVTRQAPIAARCLRLEYDTAAETRWNPPYIHLSPEPELVFDREWAKRGRPARLNASHDP